MTALFPHLTQTAAYRVLARFAQNPLALSQAGVLTPERIREFQCSGVGWNLQFWGQRVDKAALSQLFLLAEQLQLQARLRRMMDGGEVNKAYNQPACPALHTASRAVFADLPWSTPPSSTALAAEQHAQQQWQAVTTFVERLQHTGWNGEANTPPPTDIVHIGIGGSHLGIQACYKALRPLHRQGCRVHFLSSAHPDAIERIAARVNPKQALLVSVSKSGSTLEPMLNTNWALDWLKRTGLNPEKRLVWITAAKPPRPCLAYFRLLEHIGGRYSVCSTVGTLSLGFALGTDSVKALLRGARLMDLHTYQAPPRQNLPLLMALFGLWNRNFLRLPGVVVTPYHPSLGGFIGHLQQLEMESNGKQPVANGASPHPTGPMLWGGVGENSQHAFMQWLHQGSYEAACEILAFRQANAKPRHGEQNQHLQQRVLTNALAQALVLSLGRKQALPEQYQGGERPNLLLTAKELTPLSLGALLALYEHKTVLQGFAWGINPFNQEGVEQGKDMAKQLFHNLLASQKEGTSQQDTTAEQALLQATNLF